MQKHCDLQGGRERIVLRMAETEKNKRKGYLIAIGLIGFVILIATISGGGEEREKPKPTPAERQKEEGEKKGDLSISEDRFNYYNETYLKLSKSQNKYEQEYARFGVVGFEEAKSIPEDAEFPKYGSIKREIIPIHQSLPKFNSDMLLGEKHLIFKLATYSSSLIFMTPKEDGIEGIDFVSESREILENALREVKDFNHF